MKYFIALVIAFLLPKSFATSYYPPLSVTATTSSTQVLAQNNLRTYLLIQNTGAVGVIVKVATATQSAGEGILIPSGGSYEPINAPFNAVWLESVSGTSTVTIVQGN